MPTQIFCYFYPVHFSKIPNPVTMMMMMLRLYQTMFILELLIKSLYRKTDIIQYSHLLIKLFSIFKYFNNKKTETISTKETKTTNCQKENKSL